MREAGYYWVKYEGHWVIARYSKEADTWWLTRDLSWYSDESFEAIDENKIVRDFVVSKFIEDIAKSTGDSPEQVIKTLREHYNG